MLAERGEIRIENKIKRLIRITSFKPTDHEKLCLGM